ncbi:hypothetical protein Cylst_1931 [Cylindrospermum stagnale PCC 7417]|uniref:Contractile injection system tube protein N-terminal domain-containing protein n=1 Tax=Cylindrospermum stagnale PCC 7417 TaxID=56107 RepID=K9WWJ2_9NOST|nr:hypothetical protein [Cylindrospermum stagnale]AFZ24179.1 hypothetical protein Cylst_1931 [Cylindrospermum stagnale PCC 7417]
MSNLQKAKLLCVEGGASPIIFQFNPNELKFSRQSNLNPSEGARTEDGITKLSFANPAPCTLTISNIILDTYESQGNLTANLEIFKESVRFAKSGEHAGERPPIYLFIWGGTESLRCFVQSLDYSLTMFLPDGTPVRAKVNLTLKEADDSTPKGSVGTPAKVDRQGNKRPSKK